MALPPSGQISMDNIRVELGVPSQAPFDIDDARKGIYVALNPYSPTTPPATGQVSISDWYSYCQSCTSPFPEVTDFRMEQADDGFGNYWALAFITLSAPLTQHVNFNINFTFNGVPYTSAAVPMGIGDTTIVGGYNVTGNQPAGGLVAPICIQDCTIYGTSTPADVNIPGTFTCSGLPIT